MLRIPKGPPPADIEAVDKAGGMDVLVRDGARDVLILGIGSMASVGVEVAARLADQGIGVTVVDPRWGNFVTRSLGDYHVPSNLDIGTMDAIFIREDDTASNKLGVKGIGEVGIVGVAAAVANAVFNATGKRVRELPITPDKLL